MRISKEKLEAIKKRGRSAGKAVAAGGKTTVYEGAAGVATAYAGALLRQNFSFVQNKPWAEGAALVAVGHFLKRSRKLGSVGAAICGAGGYALGQYLRNRKSGATAATTNQLPAASTPAALPPSQTQGLYGYEAYNDTGLVVRSAAAAV